MNGRHISDEDLVLYSVQSLPAGETAASALHLEECAECARRLAEVAGDLALLSLSVDQQPLPEGARDRFINRIAAKPHAVVAAARSTAPVVAPPKTAPAPARVIHEVKPRRNWFPILIPWAAAFGLLALAGYLGNRNQRLNDLLNNDKGRSPSYPPRPLTRRRSSTRSPLRRRNKSR